MRITVKRMTLINDIKGEWLAVKNRQKRYLYRCPKAPVGRNKRHFIVTLLGSPFEGAVRTDTHLRNWSCTSYSPTCRNPCWHFLSPTICLRWVPWLLYPALISFNHGGFLFSGLLKQDAALSPGSVVCEHSPSFHLGSHGWPLGWLPLVDYCHIPQHPSSAFWFGLSLAFSAWCLWVFSSSGHVHSVWPWPFLCAPHTQC